VAAAEQAFDQLARPEVARLDETIRSLEGDRKSLVQAQTERDRWLEQHPEAAPPQTSFDLDDLLDRLRPAAGGWEVGRDVDPVGMDRGAEVAAPDLGIDIGP